MDPEPYVCGSGTLCLGIRNLMPVDPEPYGCGSGTLGLWIRNILAVDPEPYDCESGLMAVDPEKFVLIKFAPIEYVRSRTNRLYGL